MMISNFLPNLLSSRAQNFAGIYVNEGYSRWPSVLPVEGGHSGWRNLSEAARAADSFEETFGGVDVIFLGGGLEGELRLGISGPESAWRVRQGPEVFKCASHPTLQCVIVGAADGRIGSSWSREFNPLFESTEKLIEDAAMWGSFQGWMYVAVGPFLARSVVAKFPGLEHDSAASGNLVSWWRSADLAVSEHPYISPGRGENPQTVILARDESIAVQACGILRADGLGDEKFSAAETYGSVPFLGSLR